MFISLVIETLLGISYILNENEGVIQDELTPLRDGSLLRRCGSLTRFPNKNDCLVSELDVFGTMPKRVRSKSVQKSKRARESVDSSGRRISIPRNCKSSLPISSSIMDFDYLSKPSNKIVMGANQIKSRPTEKEVETKKVKEEASGWSSDELDVVYDLQEEKKNKIYEVITVMSDDETPNKITYEKLYADDGENKVVEKPIDLDISGKTDVLSVNNAAKAAVSILEDILSAEKVSTVENSASAVTDSKDDSDNDVVCIAVVDAKTKEEQRRANIEEICLSSDSEPESRLKVPPLRVKLSKYPCVNKYLPNNSSEHSFGSNNSNFNLGLKRPCLYPPYGYGRKQSDFSNSLSDWDSCSTSPKVTSSDEFSPCQSESPKVISDESSSSVLSDLTQPQDNFSSSSDNSNSTSPSSNSDEEKEIYWKANRGARRKGELRYEEFTDLGKKIHDGVTEIDVNNSLTFKVMSYNVLAQNLLEQHMYLYKNHDRRALSWAKRWDLLYNEIKDENPEILCLQEVEQSHLVTHYAKLLDLGYRWVYKKRTSHYQDGVAVFYKAAVFQEEAKSEVEFYQPGVSVLDRDNVGVVVRLRLREHTQQAVVVATTHLLYNPRRSDVKLAQTQVLLAEIDRLAFKKETSTYYPIIMTGDFNLKPRNGVYQLVTEGQLLYEGMSRRTLRKAEDNNVLPRTLLPVRLGVTDHCQHLDVLEARAKGEDCTQTRLYHSEHNKEPHQDNSLEDNRFSSGTLYHDFNFQSVYPHTQSDGQREASTHHDNWITVDYVFYSNPKSNEGENRENSLQLLSRLRLPTQDECERFLRHLPNFAFGSDHLPLVGKFLLRLH
uniref:Endonuclease/exonuclease/phosphatase domain-containing protein n=1 Tax=Cuerna arida TaxID=1464854 RepID=A0A1B6F7X5_9HEMI